MDLTKSILQEVREGVGLASDVQDFDPDLLIHINAGIVRLNQAGVGKLLVVKNEDQTWGELMDETQVEGNKSFPLIPQYITLSTKVIFDPPPPSSIEPYHNLVSELLWRLKLAYEPPLINVVIEEGW